MSACKVLFTKYALLSYIHKPEYEAISVCVCVCGFVIVVQIDRMEAKVVKPLLEYEGVCKKAKVRLKHKSP